MSQGKTKTVRKNVTLSAATVQYLEELARAGTHGSDVVAVIRTLVEQGVRQAIRDGDLQRHGNPAQSDRVKQRRSR
nr:hypothetical protein [Sphingomonas sp.]